MSMSIKHRIEAYQDLFRRYGEVFLFFWKQRNKITPPTLLEHESEFLPAALAIQTRPVSPAARWLAKLFMLLLIILLLWSILGKVDIVASGRGKIIPSGYTKTISSIEIAKVTSLNVEEGQKVKQGDVLIELDNRISESEYQKADGNRQLALLQIERAKALLQAIEINKEPNLAPIPGVNQHYLERERKHLQDVWQDYEAKKNRLNVQILRYQQQLPLAAQKANDYAALLKTHDVAEHAWIEKQQAYYELQGQLSDAQSQLRSLYAETRKTAQEELYQATRNWSDSHQDTHKAAAHSSQLNLTAPVDGTVQQLTVHTVGGVVTAAQPLMLVVPSKSNVEFEAYIENKDIGFIQPGQRAQVKIDTFEYTKYGTLEAVVVHVSQDAIDLSGTGAANGLGKDADSAEKKGAGSGGLVYSVKMALQKSSMFIDGKNIPLSPGMSGSVEILTGERRIIEYLLSPLLTHARESLNER
jgi:hemolysin D